MMRPIPDRGGWEVIKKGVIPENGLPCFRRDLGARFGRVRLRRGTADRHGAGREPDADAAAVPSRLSRPKTRYFATISRNGNYVAAPPPTYTCENQGADRAVANVEQ